MMNIKSFGILLILVGVLAAWFTLGLNKKNDALKLQIDQVVHIPCLLQKQSCRINVGKDLTLEISISPTGFPSMEPLTIQLRSDEMDLEQLNHFSAVLIGRDMDMGEHKFTLLKTPNTHLLQAKGMIPLCPMDPEMVWLLKIQFKYLNKATSLEFELSSKMH